MLKLQILLAVQDAAMSYKMCYTLTCHACMYSALFWCTGASSSSAGGSGSISRPTLPSIPTIPTDPIASLGRR